MARCNAKSKRTGKQCGKHAMSNGKCYFHGGATPKKHPNFRGSMNSLKHGLHSKVMKEFETRMKTDLGLANRLYEAIMQNEPIDLKTFT